MLARALFWAAGIAFAVGIAPLVSTFAAGGIAKLAGCALNEAGGNSCRVLGMELGGVLSFMAVLGWLFFFTIFPLLLSPLLLVAGLVARRYAGA